MLRSATRYPRPAIAFFSLVFIPGMMGIHAAADRYPTFEILTRSGNTLVIQSGLDPIVINRIHSWEIILSTADGTPVQNAIMSLQGGMPDHNHGLPTQPRVTGSPEPGRYLIEGIRFHMPGNWEITLSIKSEAGNDSATLEFSL